MIRRLLPVLPVIVLAACSTPGASDRIVPAAAPEVVPIVAPTSAPIALGTARPLGSAPEDLRTMAWDAVTVPGEFCDLDRDPTLESGNASAISRTWGPVVVTWFDVQYGDVVGDARVEAALRLDCNNGGGTAVGLLQYAIVLFTSEAGQLWTLGAIVPRRQPPGQLPTLMAIEEWRSGALLVAEKWYRSSDSTCCPSGLAEVTWTWQDGTLVPGPVRITG